MKIIRCFAAPLTAAFLLFNASAFAQPNVSTPTAKTETTTLDAATWRAIHVRNVRPSLIAWQLDGAHNVMPAFLNVPYIAPMKQSVDLNAPERVNGPFGLPEGVQLAASDERNLLFVAGADAAQIAQLQESVEVLDQPLRHTELEAQFVELSAKDAEAFGIASDAATPGAPALQAPQTGKFQVGFVREDFQKRIDKLVKDDKATIVSTQPQNIINNTGLAISLRSGPIDNTGANQNKAPLAPKDGSDTIITLTPTINGDDTITVLMNIATAPENMNPAGLMTVANVRDGQTIALTGLPASVLPHQAPKVQNVGGIPFYSELFQSKTAKDDRVTLIFVSARVVRDEK